MKVKIRNMTASEQKKAAKEFKEKWTDKGYEKGEGQIFWFTLLDRVYGVEKPEEFIKFEDKVLFDTTNFIDGIIDETHVLIEQKSIDKDLRKPIKQSDGSLLTPFQQAKKYSDDLPYNKKPRWIVTCNFKSFLIYDMNKPRGEPEEILLKNLPKEYYRLSFLTNVKSESIKKEQELSVKAGELVGKIYNAFFKEYKDMKNEYSQKSLNELCVRLVFCLYAEDAGLFGGHSAFHDYILKYEDLDQMRTALIDLFKVFGQKEEDRDAYISDELARFPYVNGGLFSNENIEIPRFTEEIRDLLLAKASEDFNWCEISPTIFGAVFESTLNPEIRRKGGMHYTSIENIHKVIDPLFLDDLRKELDGIKKLVRGRNKKLLIFQNKIAALTFLDPACGSGNFLTETYISLREMENEIIETINNGQIMLDLKEVIKVNINQFYGIEINDFAVSVAKTALWIAENQMMERTRQIIHKDIEFLPLKSYTNIVEGNALRINWNDVVDKNKLNYIMGNPPFVGYKFQTGEQKMDIKKVANDFKNSGALDYVACWYIKSTNYIKNSKIKCALVSTNSVCQGESVINLWKPLHEKGIQIDYAYTPFKWNSESNKKAQVICVIVGFSNKDSTSRTIKKLYYNGSFKIVNNINAYLTDAQNIFITKRSKPLDKKTPQMTKGSAAMDNGEYIISKEEAKYIIKKYPHIEKFIKKHIDAQGYINNDIKYCLWLKDATPNEIKNNKYIFDKVNKVKEFRLKSKRGATIKAAQTPHLFAEIRQPSTQYIMIPVVSSDKRKYIPMGYLSPEIINSYASFSIPNASIYELGILESSVHMAWIRTLCGRLGNGYRYSSTIVYNNFPWCNPTKFQKEDIEQTAQGILDARALYPNSSLADLYDDLTMPIELKKAHEQNDMAVMEAYGFTSNMTETEIVAELMKMYEKLTQGV